MNGQCHEIGRSGDVYKNIPQSLTSVSGLGMKTGGLILSVKSRKSHSSITYCTGILKPNTHTQTHTHTHTLLCPWSNRRVAHTWKVSQIHFVPGKSLVTKLPQLLHFVTTEKLVQLLLSKAFYLWRHIVYWMNFTAATKWFTLLIPVWLDPWGGWVHNSKRRWTNWKSVRTYSHRLGTQQMGDDVLAGVVRFCHPALFKVPSPQVQRLKRGYACTRDGGWRWDTGYRGWMGATYSLDHSL